MTASAESPESPAFELHNVTKLYGRTAALKATTLRLDRGQVLALLGPNGSGKTTLLKILAGAITPTAGTGHILGYDMVRDRGEIRGDVGLSAVESYLYDDLSASENLRFISTMAGGKPASSGIDAALQRVSLTANADQRARSFSSGMKRRLALARLVLLQPRLLLLDEPYNSLDAEGADVVDALIRETVQRGGAAVVATHDAERILQQADLVAVLDRGSLRQVGPAGDYRITARASTPP